MPFRPAFTLHVGLLFCIFNGQSSAAPVIYSSPTLESPVQSAPGDLLLLPGSGFSFSNVTVYRRITDGLKTLEPPKSLPSKSSADAGIADLVSASDIPNSIVVRLPRSLQANQPYGVWVRNGNGEWSNGVQINNSRPIWVTPDRLYESAYSGGQPRELKIVGRNLQSMDGAHSRVRLLGPRTYVLEAHSDNASATELAARLDPYVAVADLPLHLVVGSYRVEFSRDGIHWQGLLGDGHSDIQILNVLPNPIFRATFNVADPRYGECKPDDDKDDSQCIIKAIADAQAHGGGSVIFGRGVWLVRNSQTVGVDSARDGIVVPPKVNLKGSGPNVSIIEKRPELGQDQRPPRAQVATFSLLGENDVTGLTFRDTEQYRSDEHYPYISMLQLGRSGQQSQVALITITNNSFEFPYIAVLWSARVIDHLVITRNIFGAFYTALFAGESATNSSIISNNIFYPGSFMDLGSKQGTIATQLGGGTRNDFSHNLADGASSRFLYHPSTDVRGWRAAFFWALNSSANELLISDNISRCSGDKDGDGELVALDNNLNISPLRQEASVISSTSTSLTSTVTLSDVFAIPKGASIVPDSFYKGFWLRVGGGSGIGQTRQIVHYESDGPDFRVTVAPAFDVLPQPGAAVSVEKSYWQAYVVGNLADERAQSSCLKSNRTKPQGGLISLYGNSADSVAAGNLQYNSSGILIASLYVLNGANLGHYFLEVRDNIVRGEYDSSRREAYSGIDIWLSATREPNAPPASIGPPILGYGIVVAHNRIDQSAGLDGGALDIAPSWWVGPTTSKDQYKPSWHILQDTLIYGNHVTRSLDRGGKDSTMQDRSRRRSGISILGSAPDQTVAWGTVLSDNECRGYGPLDDLVDHGISTVRFCKDMTSTSTCECQDSNLSN